MNPFEAFFIAVVLGNALGDLSQAFQLHTKPLLPTDEETLELNMLKRSMLHYLTFSASASGLISADGEEIHPVLSPKLSVFYKSPDSDLNTQTTEVIKENPNPNWMKVFKIVWKDGSDEIWHFKLKSQGKVIGEAKLNPAEFVYATSDPDKNTYEIPLSENAGLITLTRTKSLTFQLTARNLAKEDTWGGKSDPYVICYWRRGPDGYENEFYKTAWIGNMVDAHWDERIIFDAYVEGTDQYLHFKIYDDDGFTSDDFLGEAFLKLDSTNSDGTNSGDPFRRVLTLVNEPSKHGKGTGSLQVNFEGSEDFH